MRQTNHTNRSSRTGFTLVEILVVLAIIALLLSLTTAAVQRVRVTQMVRTSENVVSKIQMGLDNQVKVIADNVRKESVNPGSTDFNNLKPFCDNDPDRTAAVLLYCRLRQNFPQTATEINSTMAAPRNTEPGFTLSWATGRADFSRPLAFATLNGISGNAQQISAAALYAALSGQTQGGNTFAADEALAGAQIDVTLGPVSARVFKDGWGNPIPFVRFFQSPELDAPPYCDGKFGTGPAPGKDPFDAWAKIYGWTGGTSGANKPQVLALGTSSMGASFAWGRNTTVLVYSAGLDKTFDAPIGSVDDILGYRLRSIGAKGGPKQ